MTKNELRALIIKLKTGEGVILKTSELKFELKKVKLLEETLILFGNSAKISLWTYNESGDMTSIIREIESHLSTYKTESKDRLWLDIGQIEETINQDGVVFE
jgi:hypothetical protein